MTTMRAMRLQTALRGMVAAISALAMVSCVRHPVAATGPEMPVAAFSGPMAATAGAQAAPEAPEFPAGLAWLNTDHPFTLKDLRGKVVLLDFWTYG